jgi:hypothetical protein
MVGGAREIERRRRPGAPGDAGQPFVCTSMEIDEDARECEEQPDSLHV